MSEYYDGTKILSMLDINNETPEIYIVDGNRSAGKTTYFNRWRVKKCLNSGEKTVHLFRFDYELKGCEDKIFKEVGNLFFSNYCMSSQRMANGKYYELTLINNITNEAISYGYAIALNNADSIKKCSHLLSDCSWIIFDEFQSENNNYCKDEVNKLLSIHTSLARGQGKQVKRLPITMLSNSVSLLNPYYTALGISKRIKDNTKFLKGEGFILEKTFNATASEAQQKSGFNRAFNSLDYIKYMSENVYLNDSTSFIEKLDGRNRYLATIKYKNKEYAIKSYDELGVLYCSDTPDTSFKYKIAVTTADHNINYVMLKNNDIFINSMRWYFSHGCFRFQNLECKEVILSLLSY